MQAVASDLSRLIDEMPPLPDVAMKVLEIVNDVEFSMEELVRVIRNDPSLTTRVLNLCNSSLFAVRNEIVSIEQALSFLGIRNIVRTVVTSCTSSYFETKNPSTAYLEARVIWRHSIACAMACQDLAREIGGVDEGTAYTAGVLHNIGKVPLAQLLDLHEGRLDLHVSESEDALIQAERLRFGIDHAQIAAFVTDRWQVPNALQTAIRDHHDLDAIRGADRLTSILHVSDILCIRAGIGRSPNRSTEFPFLEPALEVVGKTPEELDALGADILDELDRSEEIVNMV